MDEAADDEPSPNRGAPKSPRLPPIPGGSDGAGEDPLEVAMRAHAVFGDWLRVLLGSALGEDGMQLLRTALAEKTAALDAANAALAKLESEAATLRRHNDELRRLCASAREAGNKLAEEVVVLKKANANLAAKARAAGAKVSFVPEAPAASPGRPGEADGSKTGPQAVPRAPGTAPGAPQPSASRETPAQPRPGAADGRSAPTTSSTGPKPPLAPAGPKPLQVAASPARPKLSSPAHSPSSSGASHPTPALPTGPKPPTPASKPPNPPAPTSPPPRTGPSGLRILVQDLSRAHEGDPASLREWLRLAKLRNGRIRNAAYGAGRAAGTEDGRRERVLAYVEARFPFLWEQWDPERAGEYEALAAAGEGARRRRREEGEEEGAAKRARIGGGAGDGGGAGEAGGDGADAVMVEAPAEPGTDGGGGSTSEDLDEDILWDDEDGDEVHVPVPGAAWVDG
ncbi:hypothetical protein DFJ74DRAFT_768493 [Hyaloraphidium curvatum]|nr:hypothetical protein DFJ74DRAFT_768493 [Hyaloraphidium curvatum]